MDTLYKNKLYFSTPTLSQVRQIHQLEKKLFTDAWPLSNLAAHATTGYKFIAGALLSNPYQIVAYAIINPRVGNEVDLAKIAVDSQYHNMGLGRQILDRVILQCYVANYTTINLNVRKSNYAAQHLYETSGFKIVSECDGYYLCPAETAVVMKRSLI